MLPPSILILKHRTLRCVVLVAVMLAALMAQMWWVCCCGVLTSLWNVLSSLRMKKLEGSNKSVRLLRSCSNNFRSEFGEVAPAVLIVRRII